MKPAFNKTLLACALALAMDASHAAGARSAPATVAGATALAPPGDCIDLRAGISQRIALVRGKSQIKRFCTPASQVTVGAPEVADVVVPSASEVVIVPRSVGSTNMIVSGKDKRSTVIDIDVGIDTGALRAQFEALFPQEKEIRISNSGNTLILSGTVSDALVASQLVDLATAFNEGAQLVSGGEAGSPPAAGAGTGAATAPASASKPDVKAPNRSVINMLAVAAPQQVMLEVKIAEVSKSLVDQLGAQAGYSKSNGSWTYGILSNLLSGGAGRLSAIGNGAKSLTIDGENRDGLVKILAEPNVMAISGQEASFLAGGKIFIPVAQNNSSGNNTITLEEKEYGVAVRFTPTVLGSGRINLRVAPEVSELNREGIGVSLNGAASAILPAFTTRRASTTVQLQDGQSFAIGGLIRNNVTSNIRRYPFLGEVPVLGSLFRSSDFQNDRSELVFIVTPHLVKPMEAVPALPTDAYVAPTRAEFLLEGKHEGAAVKNAAAKDKP
ncbi:type II and III secretion system protein family protein [Massilia sp.]|uniref:type II and III secretion system protein family protein n=1 Tax=Massilia sp. TaxID=1882437 RepID=UPI002897D019|nr:type II and III secretion system protein family protein [Massilia sp.]